MVLLLMIRQGDNEKLIGAIITDHAIDEHEAHSDCLNRMFHPAADMFRGYAVDVHPTVPGFPASMKNRLITDPATLDSLQEVVLAHAARRN
jgi:hypothetical protein